MTPDEAADLTRGGRITPRAVRQVAYLLSPRQPGRGLPIDSCQGESDWKDILWTAGEHFVTPTLLPALKRNGLWQSLSPQIHSYLYLFYELNAERNRQILELVKEVVEILGHIAIEPVMLKGGATIFELPDDEIGGRVLRDLDVLVPKELWKPAIRAMEAEGFEAKPHVKPDQHDTVMLRGGNIVRVEIHTEVLSSKSAFVLPADQAIERALPLAKTAIRARQLSPTDRVLHNVLHSEVQDEHSMAGMIDLRNLNDLVEFDLRFGQEIDWACIRDAMEEHGFGFILGHYLALANRLFGQEIPVACSVSTRNVIHYHRCLTQLRWPRLEPAIRFVYGNTFELSRIGIRRNYGPDCSLWRGRLMHLAFLLRRAREKLGEAGSRHDR